MYTKTDLPPFLKGFITPVKDMDTLLGCNYSLADYPFA